jgi:hypothetical protein
MATVVVILTARREGIGSAPSAESPRVVSRDALSARRVAVVISPMGTDAALSGAGRASTSSKDSER